MGELIEKLESWADILTGVVGSRENPFVMNLMTEFGSNILTFLVWILTIMVIVTSGLDLMFICFPGYRLILSAAKDKVMAAFGKSGNGTGGVRLAHTTRDIAARKSDTDGVASGLLYYLRHRVYFYIIFGAFVTIFSTGRGITPIAEKCGALLQNMYLSTLAEDVQIESVDGVGVPDDFINDNVAAAGNGSVSNHNNGSVSNHNNGSVSNHNSGTSK